MSWQLVARFATVGEADIARSALEAAGLDVLLIDEQTVALNWLYSQAVGGVKVLVPAEDAERAADILSLAPAPPDDLRDEEALPSSGAETPKPATCPDCGSVSCSRVPRLRLFLFATLLICALGAATGQSELALAAIAAAGLTLLFAPTHRCLECGERWTDPGSGARDGEAAAEAPPPDAKDLAEELCPRCGSADFHRIDYRRLKAIPLLVSYALIPVIVLWPFLPKSKCERCGFRR